VTDPKSQFNPGDRGQFEAFAVEAWKTKISNLRRLIDVYYTYLNYAEGIPQDIRQDPASRLIIALLAQQMGMGIHDISVPQQATEEIQNARH
jgi:hypothetical protein